jgi:hypothetical protein
MYMAACARSIGNGPIGHFEALLSDGVVVAQCLAQHATNSAAFKFTLSSFCFHPSCWFKGVSGVGKRQIAAASFLQHSHIFKAGDLSVVTCGSVIKLSHIPSGSFSPTAHASLLLCRTVVHACQVIACILMR